MGNFYTFVIEILKPKRMKKLYTLILSLTLFSGVTKAQLTLTKSFNEPVVGDVINQQQFDSVGVVPKTTGPAQTWDFSTFTSNTVVTVDTYTTVVSTPSAASFPLATIAQNDGNGGYTYFQSTASAFELNGLAGSQFAITFTNNATAAMWPINYLYSNNDTYSGVATAGTLSGTANGTITTTAPGNGVVMLPGSQTFSNCLQLKQINNLKAVVGTFPVTVTVAVVSTDYTYYNSAQKFPIITVSYSKQTLTSLAGPTVTTTAKIKINSAVYSGINELSLDNAISVYPNPASSFVNVDLSNKAGQNVSVEIYNQLGQCIRKENFGDAAEIKSSLNIAEMPKGLYFVQTKIGSKSVTKKLIID